MLPEQPLSSMLDRALVAGGSVGWLVSPRGSGLGFSVSGSGRDLGEALASELERLLTPQAGRTFLSLAHYSGWRDLHYSAVLGRPAWIRAGVGETDPMRIRVVLEQEGVPTAEIGRALREGDSALGIDLISDGKREGLGIPQIVRPQPRDLKDLDQVAGASQLVIERVLGWPETTFVRRSAPAGVELIDWQARHGVGGDAARRVGTIHGVLETDAPAEIEWIDGSFAESIVYSYV